MRSPGKTEFEQRKDGLSKNKIRLQIEKLKALLKDSHEETLEQLRDDSLLLADYIEEYIYQRDA